MTKQIIVSTIHEISAVLRKELEVELMEYVKPKVIANLEAQWEEPIKEQLVQNFNAKLHDEFTRLKTALRDEAISDLRPEGTAKLRAELTGPVVAILKEELAKAVTPNMK